MSTTAGVVINNVRDQVPDPSYDSSGNPLPDADGGLFRASTLYRFANDGVKALAEQLGWVVDDWWPQAITQYQSVYTMDSKWISVEAAFKDAWQMGYVDQSHMLLPQTVSGSKSMWYGLNKITDHLEVYLFPTPSNADVTTTTAGSIGASDTSLPMTSVTSFLPYGFVQIDNELIWYNKIQSGNLNPCVRGACGTTAATHNNGVTVTHTSLWLKGKRLPLEITSSTSIVELPPGFIFPLQLFILSRCRQAEQEHQEAARLMQQFQQEAMRLKGDPFWKQNQGLQIKAYGQPVMGQLAWGRVVVPTLATLVWLTQMCFQI